MAHLAPTQPDKAHSGASSPETVTTPWLEHVTLEEEQASEDPRNESVSELKATKQYFNKRFTLLESIYLVSGISLYYSHLTALSLDFLIRQESWY